MTDEGNPTDGTAGTTRIAQATPRQIRLDGHEEEYVLLSGAADGSSIVTARLRGNEVDVASWYRSSVSDEMILDPERQISLDEEALRSLATILPDLIRRIGDDEESVRLEQEHLAMAEKTIAEGGVVEDVVEDAVPAEGE